MSKGELKRLGDYICEVDVRNRDLEVKLSQGISNEKFFQQPKQVAENPYNDKVVRKGQFAFNRATTRNGNKISIAYREGEDCTVSASYCVFYVTNEKNLLSKYLMMWFRRPEFDRYAIYHSHGSAHEYFTFENMCEVELPIPPIEQQQRIVSELNTRLLPAVSVSMSKSSPSWKKRRKLFTARCLWMGLIRRICRKGGE